MVRRGDKLREHILFSAKEVFFEVGYERASMDAVSARAQTSKRSLYAHFESKERLFLETIELVRVLVLGGIGLPDDYADDPSDALTGFCARYVEILFYQGSIEMCRVVMAESVRFPDGAAQFHHLMFCEVSDRLSSYVLEKLHLTQAGATALTEHLLGRLLFPRLPRALLGLEPLEQRPAPDRMSPGIDLDPIRSVVAEVMAVHSPDAVPARFGRQGDHDR